LELADIKMIHSLEKWYKGVTFTLWTTTQRCHPELRRLGPGWLATCANLA
jgi:hypothetical protein